MPNVAAHLLNGVSEKVLLRAFEYWKNIDEETGEKIEAAVRNGAAYSNDNGPAGALEYPETQLLN